VTGIDYTLSANVENAVLTAGGIIVTGNELDNTYTDNFGNAIVEAAGGGTDTVVTGLSSYALGANLENVLMTGTSGVSVVGNELDNVLTTQVPWWMYGGTADVLDGGAGADTMGAGDGNDTYYVDNAGDVVQEGAGSFSLYGGADTVVSSVSYTLGDYVENLALTGSANLSGTGNAWNNVLTGNAGSNALSGGAGADVFRFNQALDAATNLDTLTDFSAVEGDKIQLMTSIFGALAGANLADSFVTGTAAADANDFLIYDSTSGALYYDQDGSGTEHAMVQFATLTAAPALSASDFLIG
jgi:Ca2+-binding RTX toxin-like protein